MAVRGRFKPARHYKPDAIGMSNYVHHSHPFWMHFLHNPNTRDTAAHMGLNQPFYQFQFKNQHCTENVSKKNQGRQKHWLFCVCVCVLYNHTVCAGSVCITLCFHFSQLFPSAFAACVSDASLACWIIKALCVWKHTWTHADCISLSSLYGCSYENSTRVRVMAVNEWMNAVAVNAFARRRVRRSLQGMVLEEKECEVFLIHAVSLIL